MVFVFGEGVHFFDGFVIDFFILRLFLEDFIEDVNRVLLIGDEGLVLVGRVEETVEFGQVLEMDEFVELFALVLICTDVAVVLFVEGLEHGR